MTKEECLLSNSFYDGEKLVKKGDRKGGGEVEFAHKN